MADLIINETKSIKGSAKIPGCKSISHRALILSSIANGQSRIKNLLEGNDCLATVNVMRALGSHIALENGEWIINGKGRFSLSEANTVIDCKNSGTTIRILSGLLSAMPFFSILDGTAQIKSRPMDRVIEPLTKMGAKIYGRNNNKLAPMAILPSKLKGVTLDLLLQSAQVKSAIILAALFADDKTVISHKKASRDHTEKMLSYMGANIFNNEEKLIVSPLERDLKPLNITVPGDISSAAYLIVAALFLADGPFILKDIGVNKTRTGIIDALKSMGANIHFINERVLANEEISDIVVEKSNLSGSTFSGDLIVRMIDEIPILAVAASQALGKTIIKDAQELKVKESNRISITVSELKKLGVDIIETEDGMIINGPSKLDGAILHSYGDHRIALAMSVAGLMCASTVTIHNTSLINDSFPGFVHLMQELGCSIKEVA